MCATGSRVRMRCVYVAAATVVASCTSSTGPSVRSVIVRAPAESLFFGDSLQMIAVATGDSATVANPRFAWTSSDTTVAVVDSLGKVIGVSTGTATIAAAVGGHRDEYSVRVVLNRVDGGVEFSAMARGVWPSLCALSTEGAPYCGTFGFGVPTPFEPLPKNDGLVFTTFHTSEDSRCGLTDAHLMYCWGMNDHGHFGLGLPYSFRSDTAPVLGAGGRTFAALSVGGHSHTCGVNRADSVVYCFGHDDMNQVGRGSPALDDTVVGPTGGAPRGTAVTTEDERNCLVTLDGDLMCWGRAIATPTLVQASVSFTTVVTGRLQTCALTASQDLYCWGRNLSGDVGVGSASPVEVPTLVGGSLKFAAFSPGRDATCAVTPDGALYCWGAFHPKSVSGRLGDARNAPVRVLPGLRFKSIASQVTRACGITTDGRMYCW